jgi:hypothetical protein
MPLTCVPGHSLVCHPDPPTDPPADGLRVSRQIARRRAVSQDCPRAVNEAKDSLLSRRRVGAQDDRGCRLPWRKAGRKEPLRWLPQPKPGPPRIGSLPAAHAPIWPWHGLRPRCPRQTAPSRLWRKGGIQPRLSPGKSSGRVGRLAPSLPRPTDDNRGWADSTPNRPCPRRAREILPPGIGPRPSRWHLCEGGLHGGASPEGHQC